MKNYALTEETINKVLQYLATRPYAEVVQLINAVGQAKPLADAPAAETKLEVASQAAAN